MDIYSVDYQKGNRVYNTLCTKDDIPATRIKEKKASRCEEFNFYLKQEFAKNGRVYLPGVCITAEKNSFGLYINRFQKVYDRYFSEDICGKIIKILSKDILEDYIAGEGNEISTKKYFSVASSSRFATASFSELRNGLICKSKTFNGQTIDELTFEKSCPIDNISIAYPDVYFKAGNKTFYIEAKCQEIFTDHRQVKLKSKYLNSNQFKEILRILNIMESIFDGKDGFLKYKGKTLCAENFGVSGTIQHFDFKQFLCHLMGLMSTQRKEPCNFYYLFFKLENNEFADVYNELETELSAVEKRFKPVFEKYNITFGYMFSSSFDTLKNPQIVKL